MVPTIFAKNIRIYDLKEHFGLQLIDDQFFTEWSSDLTMSTAEAVQLDRVLRCAEVKVLQFS